MVILSYSEDEIIDHNFISFTSLKGKPQSSLPQVELKGWAEIFSLLVGTAEDHKFMVLSYATSWLNQGWYI